MHRLTQVVGGAAAAASLALGFFVARQHPAVAPTATSTEEGGTTRSGHSIGSATTGEMPTTTAPAPTSRTPTVVSGGSRV